MFGPFTTMTEAAKAGFKIVKANPDRPRIEFAFWVILKPKTATYCFTEPQTNDERTKVTLQAPPDLVDYIRAYCHTHPKRPELGVGFQSPDKEHFQDSQKSFPRGIAWYLLNPFDEIRFANSERCFPWGREVKW
jgi:hypothetical protein